MKAAEGKVFNIRGSMIEQSRGDTAKLISAHAARALYIIAIVVIEGAVPTLALVHNNSIIEQLQQSDSRETQ